MFLTNIRKNPKIIQLVKLAAELSDQPVYFQEMPVIPVGMLSQEHLYRDLYSSLWSAPDSNVDLNKFWHQYEKLLNAAGLDYEGKPKT